ETKKEVLVSRSEIETTKMLKSNYNKKKRKRHQDSSLERSSSEQESDDDCESNTIDKDHDNSSVALPILKPSEKSSKFVNLHLKLNLEKNLSQSKLLFTDLLNAILPLEFNIKILIKILELELSYILFSQLYFIGENARRQDKKCSVNGEKHKRTNQLTVKGEKCRRTNQLIINDEKRERSNQPIVNDEKRERKCTQKKMTSTNYYSESHEDSYGNVDDELDKISKDDTHYLLSNPIPIYYYNTDSESSKDNVEENKMMNSVSSQESKDYNLSLPDSDDKESKPLKKICISNFDKLTLQKTTESYKAKSSKRSLKQTLVSEKVK
ncbi:14450_t:CDS:2, partial [Funneliformis caledonium]